MSSIQQTEQQQAQWNRIYEEDQATASADSQQPQHQSLLTNQGGQLQVAQATNGNGPQATNNANPTDSVNNARAVNAPNGGTVTSDAPALLNTDGAKASAKQVAQLPSDMLSTYGMAWQALEALTTLANQQEQQQARLKRDAEQQKNDDKKQEIQDTKAQIAGQRKSSLNNFMGTLAGVAGSFALGGGGMLLSNTTEMSSMAMGAGLQGAANLGGQAINSGVQAWDKLDGGGRQADDAQIAIKFDQMNEDMAQQLADTSNTNVQNAQQEWQKAQQTITDMNDRRMQASQQVANG